MSINRDWLEKDFYKVLGVPKNASQAEIKKAYRRLAQKHHPDANPGDRPAEERFKEVSAAYDVLGREKKRAEYDRVRDMAGAGFGVGGRGPGTGGFRFEDSVFGEGLEDLFGNLFGGGFGGAGRQHSRGSDLQADVRISFEDAVHGTTVSFTVPAAEPCATCGGSGAEPGTRVTTCPECSGTGSVVINQGPFSMARTCPRCSGTGRAVEKLCPACGGAGHVRSNRPLRVRIPPGIEDGARIRLQGKGEPGRPGDRPGDLYVGVRVTPHRFFGRRGADLTLTLPVTFPEVALGATIEVPTLNGSVKLKVPAGTSGGKTFRIRGKGMPRTRGGNGDLLVTVQVEVPARVSKEERELLKRFQEALKSDPRASLGESR